jgi:hypothetical protein
MHTYRIVEDVFQTRIGVLSFLGANEQVDIVEMRAGPEQFLHQHLAHEASATGDEHAGAAVEFLHLSASVANAIHICN